MQQFSAYRLAPPHQVEIVGRPFQQLAVHHAFAGKADAFVRRPQLACFTVPEAQSQSVAANQHQLPLDTGEQGKRAVLFDLRDR